jgi:hypothetical protein
VVVESIVAAGAVEPEIGMQLDAIAREGARRMLAAALRAEVAEYLEAAGGERDEQGHALVVRNGTARPRQVVTVAGAIPVVAPRVNDKRVDEDGERQRFASVILPPCPRRSPPVTEVLPLLYLHGLSTKDFVPALAEYFGTECRAVGLGNHPADDDLGRRGGGVHEVGSRPHLLPLRLGGRRALQHPPGRGSQIVLSGHRWCPT